jgi:hypothetical protein
MPCKRAAFIKELGDLCGGFAFLFAPELNGSDAVRAKAQRLNVCWVHRRAGDRLPLSNRRQRAPAHGRSRRVETV